MGTEAPSSSPPKWASNPCIMGIDEAGRGAVLGPMVYGCLYCARSYQRKRSTLNFAEVCSICFYETVYLDTVGDAEKYRAKLSQIFRGMKFVVSKKADSLYPVVSGASIMAKIYVLWIVCCLSWSLLDCSLSEARVKCIQDSSFLVTRDRALLDWALVETAEKLHRNFGSGYPGDLQTKSWLKDHTHSVFGFPTLVRFSWATCNAYSKDFVEVPWVSDAIDKHGDGSSRKRQMKLTAVNGFTPLKRKTEDTESSGQSRCKFFQARRLQLLPNF